MRSLGVGGPDHSRSLPHPRHICSLPLSSRSPHPPSTPQDPPSLCAMLTRRPVSDDDVTDDEDVRSIDPELRLRTVRTAASTLAESAAVEQRAERRRTFLMNKARKKGSFFRRGTEKKRPAQDPVPPTAPQIPGQRRTIYVNRPLPISEVDSKNEPLVRYPRNKVRTTSEPLFPHLYLLPISYAYFRIYHLHLYTKEFVRTIS